ncbi:MULTISPECIES: tautomerase family protein [Vagococcus]|uniref:Probable tautomerase yrdN n=1 Tax=Vagococcus fluvialis bH819 TaxID=1255619 RepID=A0A1X6WP26_9ENTE|nr:MULTISPECIES: tautomerase family protein [Vagococcus]SLM86083.1 Probable tautomerase yrdN [Vagococcus fluvialis bH819]HCM90332.1 tautomerase family protein [Vagococcus sp.]
MPLFKIDILEHYSKEKTSELLKIIHYNAVAAFDIPEGDRYQIVTRHQSEDMILEDTGLGFVRTEDKVAIQIFSRKREKAMKLLFYKQLVSDLHEKMGLNKKDILISFFENEDEDWSFADGEAQFITGELS